MTPKKPDYYSRGGIEMSEVIRAYQLNWHLGNVIKYVLRAGYKKKESLLKDLVKARTYLDMEIERIGRTNGTERDTRVRFPEEGQSQHEHIR